MTECSKCLTVGISVLSLALFVAACGGPGDAAGGDGQAADLLSSAVLASSAGDEAARLSDKESTIIVVNTTDDEYGANMETCSLREAIQAANTDTAFGGCAAGSGADTITLPAGVYTLTRAGAGEDANATGDLDFVSEIILNGAGADETIIDADQLDRVLQVLAGAAVTLDGVTLRDGQSPDTMDENSKGGGVYSAGVLTIENSFISENTAAYHGGGVYCNTGTLAVVNSSISGNTATYAGGGIYNSGGALIIESSTIDGNTTGTSRDGGGIYNFEGTLTINHSTISNNISSDSGGGISVTDCTTTIENSAIVGNSSIHNGGGVENWSKWHTLTIRNCTFSGNSAALGGGLDNADGTVNIENCTFANNTANLATAMNQAAGTVSAKNSIFANTCGGTIVSQGYNLVGLETGCPYDGTGDKTTSNPKLSPLADNGGPTQTYALLYSSPAVDAIPSGVNGCGTDYTTDQRGFARPVGGSCDIGAYESPFIFWDGGGADDKTSTAANWRGDILPGATDIPVFFDNGNVVVDDDLTVAGWIVDNDTGNEINLWPDPHITVNGDWLHRNGYFNGDYNGVIEVSGAFDMSDGQFIVPRTGGSGWLSVGGGIHQTGGEFEADGGRVILNPTSDQTLEVTSSFGDLTINDGLIGYWKLDEGEGETAADSSGYGNTATLRNGPAWSADTPDTDFYDASSLRFDRTNAPYVLTDSIPKLDEAETLTLSTWVRLASTPGGSGLTYMRFITLENEKTVLRYYDDNGTGKLQFYMRIGGSIHSILVDHTWATDTWYHVAGSYDGSTMRLYLNGDEVGTKDVSGTADSGGWVRLSHSANDAALDGLLDDVRIYDRALSSTEIDDLAAGKHPRTSLATITLEAPLDVNGDLILNSGTLDVSPNYIPISVAGNFIRNGGVFNPRYGSFTFGGSGIQALDTDTITFFDLSVNPGTTLHLFTGGDVVVGGEFTHGDTLAHTRKMMGGITRSFLEIGDGMGGYVYRGAEVGTEDDLGDVTVEIHEVDGVTTFCDHTDASMTYVHRCYNIETEIEDGFVPKLWVPTEAVDPSITVARLFRYTAQGWEETFDSNSGTEGDYTWVNGHAAAGEYIIAQEAVDECNEGTDTCDEHAACTDETFGYACACNPGYIGDGFTCTACPAGTYQPDSGQSACLDCPADTYQSEEGQSVCLDCTTGWTSTSGATACTENCGDGLVVGNEDCDKVGGAFGECCDPITCLYRANGIICGDEAAECSGQDTCDGEGTCQTNDLDASTRCGDDGTECVNQDYCDGSGSCTDNGFVAVGTACGDGLTECSAQDTCNGEGVCQPNDFGTDHACGDAATECVNQDYCDGSGSCTDNGFAAVGTTCGDGLTECSDQDTCNGEGICQANDMPDNTGCDDLDLCTGDDVCIAGECVGTATDCADDHACTADTCDPGTGQCVHTADDSLCDDAGECTADACSVDTGCSHADLADWTACGEGDDDACFTGVCEPLGENDTCETAIELTAGTQKEATFAGFHTYRDASTACGIENLRGRDAFFVFSYEPGYAYTVTVTPSEYLDMALVGWEDCSDGRCVEAIDAGGAGDAETVTGMIPEAAGSMIVQIIDLTAGEPGDDAGFSVLMDRSPVADGDLDADSQADGDEEDMDGADIGDPELEPEAMDSADDVAELEVDAEPEVDAGTETADRDIADVDGDAGEIETDADPAEDREDDADIAKPSGGSAGSGCRSGGDVFWSFLLLMLLGFGGFLRRRTVPR